MSLRADIRLGLILFLTAWSFGSPPQAKQAQDFAGTWEGKFEDKVFVTLKLSAKGDVLTGTVSRSTVSMNGEGELISAQALEGEDAMLEPEVKDGTLHFSVKRQKEGEEDEPPTIRFEMRLTGEGEAELLLIAPEGEDAPPIKPWKLARKKVESPSKPHSKRD